MQSLLEQQKAAALAALPRCDLLQAAAALPAAGLGGKQPQEEGKADGGAAAGEPPGLTAEQAAAVKLLVAAVTVHQQAAALAEPPPVVCAVVATLAAHSAQCLLDVLLHLAQQQPEVAAHLLLHSLDPASWELLSGAIERRQEELAAEGGELVCVHKESGPGGACASCLPCGHQWHVAWLAHVCWLGFWIRMVLLGENCPSRPCPNMMPSCCLHAMQAVQQQQRRRWEPCAMSCTGGSGDGQFQAPRLQRCSAIRSDVAWPSHLLCSCVDRHALLDAILQRKEAFSRQALRAVLATELAGPH